MEMELRRKTADNERLRHELHLKKREIEVLHNVIAQMTPPPTSGVVTGAQPAAARVSASASLRVITPSLHLLSALGQAPIKAEPPSQDSSS